MAKEDLSDMVAEHAAKQSNKRKRPQGKNRLFSISRTYKPRAFLIPGGTKDDKGTKKYKEFKF